MTNGGMAWALNEYTYTERTQSSHDKRSGRVDRVLARSVHTERYKWIRRINESCLWGRILLGIWNINGEMHFRQRKRMAGDCRSIYFPRTVLSPRMSARHALESLFEGTAREETFLMPLSPEVFLVIDFPIWRMIRTALGPDSFVHRIGTRWSATEIRNSFSLSRARATFIDIASLKYSKERERKKRKVVNVEGTEVINYAVEYLHNDFYYYWYRGW